MKRLMPGFLMLFLFGFSGAAWGEDITLLLTVRTEVNLTPLKIDLRLGLWKEGQDGLDSFDTRAMTNALFDAYFELPSGSGGPPLQLWWDIRSFAPGQKWTLKVISPRGIPFSLEWKELASLEDLSKVSFVLEEPDAGSFSYLNQPSGSISMVSPGVKTFIIKTVAK